MEAGRFFSYARRLFHYNGAMAAAARKAAAEQEPEPGPVSAVPGNVQHVPLTHPSLAGLIEMK
jgi:hypothetical protein